MHHNDESTPIAVLLKSVNIRTLGGSVRYYLDLLMAGRNTILLSLATVLSLTAIYWAFATPVYKAYAVLQIDKSKAVLAMTPDREVNAALVEVENPKVQNEMEILRSRSVLGKVVEDLNLAVEVSPIYFPFFGEVLARSYGQRNGVSNVWWPFHRWAWGGEVLKIDNFDVPDRYLDKAFTLVALENSRFRLLSPEGNVLSEGIVGESMTVGVSENTLVTIDVAALAARDGEHFEVIRKNSLAATESLLKAFSFRKISKDTDILGVTLKGSDPELLAKTVNDIATIYVNATVNWESSEASQKLSFLESQLPIIKERLENAERALNDYRQKHGALNLSSEAEILMKQASDLETIVIQLTQKYDELSQRLESTHPEMIATNIQIRRVSGKLASLVEDIKELPSAQQLMVGLSQDVRVNDKLYNSLLNSIQEQRIALSGSLGKSRVVDYAAIPEKPYWPKPGLLLAIASLLGVSLGGALVLVRHSQQSDDNSPASRRYSGGLPQITATGYGMEREKLPEWIGRGKSSKGGILAGQDSPDICVDSRHGLRTTLEVVLAENIGKVIVVSSPVPGVGKSFVGANLSALLASIKKRVLIIDADMQNGHLHEAFLIENQPGLSDLLSGKATLGEVIVSLPETGVDLIPRGRTVSNPEELLVQESLYDTLDQLKSFYNHIVINSPPIMNTTDAAIICKHVDATFLVVNEGSYATHALELTFQRLQQAGVNPSGLIINDRKEGFSYYAYDGDANQGANRNSKHAPDLGDRYKAVGDWLGRQLMRDYLPSDSVNKDVDESPLV